MAYACSHSAAAWRGSLLSGVPSGYFRQKAKNEGLGDFYSREYGGSLHRLFVRRLKCFEEEDFVGARNRSGDGGFNFICMPEKRGVCKSTPNTTGSVSVTEIPERQPDYLRRSGALSRGQLFRAIRNSSMNFNALVVNTAKNWCARQRPRCAECPLGSLLPENSPLFKMRVTK